MIPEKKEEYILFTTKSIEELFAIYRPMCTSLLETVEFRSPLTHSIILSDLEMELRKALQHYKEHKRYKKDFHFSSYYFSAFKAYVNEQIERGLVRMRNTNKFNVN